MILYREYRRTLTRVNHRGAKVLNRFIWEPFSYHDEIGHNKYVILGECLWGEPFTMKKILIGNDLPKSEQERVNTK